MLVVKQREHLQALIMSKGGNSGQQYDEMGVFTRLLKSRITRPEPSGSPSAVVDCVLDYDDHWRSIIVLSLCVCGLMALPVELTRLPLLEKIYLDNNRLSSLSSDIGNMKNLKFSVLTIIYLYLYQALCWTCGIVTEAQQISPPSSRFQVEQACSALPSLTTDVSLARKAQQGTS